MQTHSIRRAFRHVFVVTIICWAGFSGRAQTNVGTASPSELKRLSLEELLNVEVTSVSRREEKVSEAPASIHLITQDDIRRSGARSIPEALRLAPNLNVAQASSRDWNISARGFNAGTLANKLLVMIDGRTVYTPLFSGVFWDVQDYPLEDLDRIEVISGPGATLWGANAVNGVVNIISKSARETQGFLGTAGGGTEERGFGSVRYGGKISDDIYYRAYAKYFDRDATVFPNGDAAADSWTKGQGGFRVDWDVREDNLLTVQGDAYDGREDQLFGKDISIAGGNILSRWTRNFSEDSRFETQVYYDRTHRFQEGTFGEDRDTFDIDSQYGKALGDRQNLLVGLGYRFTKDRVKNTPALAFFPAKLDRNLFTSFIQDEIEIVPDAFKLTLGSKFELNDYTGFEVQPSIRGAWTGERQVIWGAVSRAVRTPSRIDRHFFVPGTAPFALAGGPDFESETVIAYELGYRVQPHERWYGTATLFYNQYDDIRSVRPTTPATIANDVEGDTYGAELELTFDATDWWRLTAGYTWLEEDLRVKPGAIDLNRARSEVQDPEQQLIFRSSIDLPRGFEFDTIFRYVDTLHNISGGVIGTVPSYMTMDVRLGWHATKNLELALVGQNLFDSQHPETGFPSPTRREIERGVYAKLMWRF